MGISRMAFLEGDLVAAGAKMGSCIPRMCGIGYVFAFMTMIQASNN